jgi:hypothetical protein
LSSNSLEELAKQIVALQKPQPNPIHELAMRNFTDKIAQANSIVARIQGKLVQDVIDEVFAIPHRHKVIDIKPR